MTTRVYLWCLFGSNPLTDPLVRGASRDLAPAMRAVELELKSGRAFIGIIEEAQSRINVSGLEETYSPTGRRWSGRRDREDGVHWDAKGAEPDPAVVYRVPDVAGPTPRRLPGGAEAAVTGRSAGRWLADIAAGAPDGSCGGVEHRNCRPAWLRMGW